MKTRLVCLTLAVTLLAASPIPAVAGKAPWFAMGDPTMTMKYGVGENSNDQIAPGRTSALSVSLEAEACRKYVVCYNPFFVALDNAAGFNVVLGADAVYHMAKTNNGSSVFIAGGLGVVSFKDRLSSEAGGRLSYHFEVGVQLKHVVLSIQAFTHALPRGDTNPVDMQLLNIGYRF